MKLITKTLEKKLLRNGRTANEARAFDGNVPDMKPVMKLFSPWGSATWLITELDPDDNDTMFGLCDLGMGEPELGSVSLTELKSINEPFGLKIERDLMWEADKRLSEYADEARAAGRIRA